VTAESADLRAESLVSGGWLLRFSLVWFGLWMGYLVPIQLALPDQLDALDHQHRIRDFGLINGLAGLLALVTLPLFGALCDRTRSRIGRRRSWVLGGVAVFAAGLLLTGLAGSALAVGGGWLIASLGVNMATAGLTATIADQVPPGQRGQVSSAVYGPQAVGVLAGLLAVSGLADARLRYLLLAVAVVGFGAPFLLRQRDPEAPSPSSALSPAALLDGLRIGSPDFRWALAGRLLVNLGNAFGTTYLLFFLRDYLRVANPDASLVLLTLVYLAFTLAACYCGGLLSDRLRRRRVFVAVAAALQAAAGLLLAVLPSFRAALIGAALLGAGYGAYMSVDQALVTEVLPDPRDRAKDLGIMNVGSVVPQALGPLAAGLVISVLGGYRVLFALAGLTSVAGAWTVYRIRGIR